ncbi:antitoxin VbhA family protein [Acidiphilium acidophilum]|uniref:antitoxin VbhA family protein n=1 Tax=Acidiphilium acidophilum TaxID=76588 RepID=UPI002E8E7729|nr:antitoxin VbhA family protein [Acidiphilium acidophilum]
MDQIERPKISEAEQARRKRAIDEARASNMRQGYVHDPVLEEINERFVRGDITLDNLHDEILELVHAGQSQG